MAYENRWRNDPSRYRRGEEARQDEGRWQGRGERSDWSPDWRTERGRDDDRGGQYSRYGRDEEWDGRFGAEDYGGYGPRGGEDYERQGFQTRSVGRGRHGRDHDVERGYGGGRDHGAGRGYGGYGSGRAHGSYRGEYRDEYRGEHRGRGEERGWMERASDEVASWFGDEGAERRRRTDEMRSGEHRGRGPRGYTRSDERIRDDVNDRLTDDAWVDASDIDVTVQGGEVTLSGHVDSRMVKRRAEDIAESVSGVNHVQNNLRVRQSTGSTTSAGASAMAGMGAGATGTGTNTGTATTTGMTDPSRSNVRSRT